MHTRFSSLLALGFLCACEPVVVERPPPGDDGGAPPPGSDAGVPDAPDVDAHVRLPGSDDGGTPPAFDAGDAPVVPLDCAPLTAAGHTVCTASASACEIVFYDGSGCAAACASAGLACLASHRDDDDDAPLCARHPSGESYGCAETGHRSDYCVCGAGVPTEPPPPTGLAFEGAEGFGARSQGGQGGRVYTVTNLGDSGEGSLRWAVERSGARIVEFAVDGVITLRSALDISDPYLTIDGRGALDPGEAGITIRDYPIDIRTHDVILRYLRVRLGDAAVLRRVRASGRSRPDTSRDLDCINIHQSQDVILDHLSMSWSADEIVSVTNSRNVTIQWSILSEPLGDPSIHPYGDDHAYAANNSASTLSYHHNLFAHYRFRGPQFEANDMQSSSPRFDAQFEAINNVVYGYTSSGSRYRTGFERAADRITSVDFSYHFIGNRYLLNSGSRPEIQAAADFASESNIHVFVRGNLGPHRPRDDMDELAVVFTDTGARDPLRSDSRALAQVSATPLFAPPVPVTVQPADVARDAVLAQAGCSIERDAIDRRVVEDARTVAPARTLSSQTDVPEGWPSSP